MSCWNLIPISVHMRRKILLESFEIKKKQIYLAATTVRTHRHVVNHWDDNSTYNLMQFEQ